MKKKSSKNIFGKIKEISLKDNSTWKNRIFLIFDMDWASDEVLNYTIDVIEKYDVKATFFCTHKNKVLERMRKNSNIELGVHPDFNPLLKGDFKYGKNYREVFQYFKKIVPEAISVRCHSLTQNSKIIDLFLEKSILYECSCFIPESANISLKPFLHWDLKIIRVPVKWEDDVHCLYGWPWKSNIFINSEGLKVFTFHPIHIYLNTERLDRYKKSKKYLKNIKMLSRYINNKNYGSRQFLVDLIKKNK